MIECLQPSKDIVESTDISGGPAQLTMPTTFQFLELVPYNEAEEISRSEAQIPQIVHSKNLKEFTHDQVSCHDHVDDCWIILYDCIYDITEFLQEHPGGSEVLLEYAGRDATLAYRGFGHSAQAWKILQQYLIGVLPEKEKTHLFTQCEKGIDFRLRMIS